MPTDLHHPEYRFEIVRFGESRRSPMGSLNGLYVRAEDPHAAGLLLVDEGHAPRGHYPRLDTRTVPWKPAHPARS